MPIINRIADFQDEMTAWRHHIHTHPETAFEEHKTSAFVAEKLESFGIEVHRGLAGTGIVGKLTGGNGSGKAIGLRADMDALDVLEKNDFGHRSQHEGKMHACGHDGHTAMLLGAAKYLSETRNFDGTVVVIFQPAEEGGAGAKAMVDDGLMDRFGIQEVYGMHNMPGEPLGSFHIRPGAMMAAADRIQIDIEGVGGHAAKPHEVVDTLLVGAHIIQAVQSIASRNVDPLKSVVVSITAFNGGFTDNVIPQTARLRGTVRTLDAEIRDLAERRLKEIVPTIASAFGAKAEVNYLRDYPITINHAEQTDFAAGIARTISGDDNVVTDVAPTMGGEDFSFMLLERPGAFIFVGNGDSANLHHPAYDFNDELIPVGCSYWVKLVETAMPSS